MIVTFVMVIGSVGGMPLALESGLAAAAIAATVVSMPSVTWPNSV